MRFILLWLLLFVAYPSIARPLSVAGMETSYQQSLNLQEVPGAFAQMKYRRGERGMITGGCMVVLGTGLFIHGVSSPSASGSSALVGYVIGLEGIVMFAICGAVYLHDVNNGRPRRQRINMYSEASGNGRKAGLAFNI